VLSPLHIHQREVCLVHQGRGLECLPGLLVGELLGGQPPKLVIDQRQKLLGRLGVALVNGREDSSNLVHRIHPAA